MNSSNCPKNLIEVCNALGNLSSEISHWFSQGKFSIYDLVEYVLLTTGPAELKVTSYSLSEIAIRRFDFFRNKGMITNARFIFDFSAKRNKIALMIYASNVFEVGLIKNHTKMILVKNENYNIVISTSANLNQNLRHENGFVINDEKTYQIFENYFDNIFADSFICK